MKILYFGTSSFSAEILRFLLQQSCEIVAIITQPDKPKGRNRKLSPTPVKEFAQLSCPNIPIFQPEKASDEAFVLQLKQWSPDFLVLAAYGQIIKENLLKLPALGAINVHTSLLPKYRGANPIRRALIAGEEKSGITIMEMTKELDAGDIYAQEEIPIPLEMTYGELEKQMEDKAGPLLFDTLKKIIENSIQKKTQDHTKANYAKKLSTEELQLSWNFPAIEIHNHVRALSPKPGAWTTYFSRNERKRLKILRTRPAEGKGAPGEIILRNKNSCIVACSIGALEILRVQKEGKHPVDISEFLRGIPENFTF